MTDRIKIEDLSW